MSTEIADAYVALHTKFPGVQGDVNKALGGVNAEEGGRKIGKSASDGAGKGFALGGAVAGIAAVLTAGAISAISGLVSEAVAASDATDKFKKTLDFAGIDTTTVDTLTKSTRAYADATVYDLSTIQNTVAQLAANGVKDYDKLAEAGGNLNAVAGGNAETFKSVGTVLTQTAGAGKLTTENWNQLADAIPGASGMLQDALLQAGAYTGNFREAMEKGQISAEEFNAAIMQLGTDPVAVEAAKSTETFEGAIGNLQATIVGGLMDALNAVKPALTGLITGFSDVLGYVFDFIGALGSGLDVGMFAELAGYLSPLGLIFKVLQPILPQIAGALGQVFAVIGGAVSSILPVLLPVLAQVVAMLADLAAQVIPMLLPVIVMLAEMFGQILEAVMPIVAALLGALMPILEALIPVIITVLDAFLPLVALLIEALLPVFTAVADILMAVLVPVLETVIGVIEWLAEIVKWAVTEIIAPFFMNVLLPIIQEVAAGFTDAFGGLGDFFAGLWKGIETGFKAFVNFIIDGINGFLGGLNEMGNFLSDATGGAIDFNIGKIPRLAEGAYVNATPGGSLAVIGEGRYDEVVLPLSPEVLGALGGGGRGVTQNITLHSQDPRLAVRQMARAAEEAFASS